MSQRRPAVQVAQGLPSYRLLIRLDALVGLAVAVAILMALVLEQPTRRPIATGAALPSAPLLALGHG